MKEKNEAKFTPHTGRGKIVGITTLNGTGRITVERGDGTEFTFIIVPDTIVYKMVGDPPTKARILANHLVEGELVSYVVANENGDLSLITATDNSSAPPSDSSDLPMSAEMYQASDIDRQLDVLARKRMREGVTDLLTQSLRFPDYSDALKLVASENTALVRRRNILRGGYR